MAALGRNELVCCCLEWSNWVIFHVFLPMSAKMGVFGADLWIFLADRTIGFAGDLKMFYYRDHR